MYEEKVTVKVEPYEEKVTVKVEPASPPSSTKMLPPPSYASVRREQQLAGKFQFKLASNCVMNIH